MNIQVISFIGVESGAEKGIKFAFKSGTLDKKLFNVMKGQVKMELSKIFPNKFDDVELCDWKDEQEYLEMEECDVMKALTVELFVKVLEDYL